MNSKSILIGLVVFIVLFGMILGGSYNSFMTQEERVNERFAQVDNQMQRRADLIPNLVNTAQGYMSHEREIFENLANARAAMMGAQDVSDLSQADMQMTSALGRLFMVVENYPDLKANQQFNTLMDELAGTENRIAVARMDYNQQATSYNISIRRFPGKIIASLFGFERKDLFETSEQDRQVPQVNFQ